jgi:hypothetical protein
MAESQHVENWRIEVDHAMACNCNWGCPCAFEAPPTHGSCEAALAWRVLDGNYGEVRLDGATWLAAIVWPGPLHEGGGRAVILIDEALPAAQQRPIELIATGNAGGAISWFMGTVTAGIEVRRAPLSVNIDGNRTSFAVEGELAVEFESIKNPVTGKEHRVKTVIETGLLHPVEEHFSARRLDVNANSLRFRYTQRNAFLNRTTWYGPDIQPPR